MRREFRTYVESRGPVSTVVPLYGCMGIFPPHRLRLPLAGRLTRSPETPPLVRQGGMGQEIVGRFRAGGGPLSPVLALLGIGPLLSSPLRPSLRGWLRPSLRLSLRCRVSAEGDQSPPQRRLRAWRFADIPTPLPVQNIRSVTGVISFSTFSASLALDACAIASALAPQRFSISLAVALLIFASGVLTARLVFTRRVWRSA